VLGRAEDRDLIRTFARQLAKSGAKAEQLRATVAKTIAGDRPKRGGIIEALRRSPLVGADLEFRRASGSGRKVSL
jgi:hypothetical protein